MRPRFTLKSEQLGTLEEGDDPFVIGQLAIKWLDVFSDDMHSVVVVDNDHPESLARISLAQMTGSLPLLRDLEPGVRNMLALRVW